jgi:hypothetical protein
LRRRVIRRRLTEFSDEAADRAQCLIGENSYNRPLLIRDR